MAHDVSWCFSFFADHTSYMWYISDQPLLNCGGVYITRPLFDRSLARWPSCPCWTSLAASICWSTRIAPLRSQMVKTRCSLDGRFIGFYEVFFSHRTCFFFFFFSKKHVGWKMMRWNDIEHAAACRWKNSIQRPGSHRLGRERSQVHRWWGSSELPEVVHNFTASVKVAVKRWSCDHLPRRSTRSRGQTRENIPFWWSTKVFAFWWVKKLVSTCLCQRSGNCLRFPVWVKWATSFGCRTFAKLTCWQARVSLGIGSTVGFSYFSVLIILTDMNQKRFMHLETHCTYLQNKIQLTTLFADGWNWTSSKTLHFEVCRSWGLWVIRKQKPIIFVAHFFSRSTVLWPTATAKPVHKFGPLLGEQCPVLPVCEQAYLVRQGMVRQGTWTSTVLSVISKLILLDQSCTQDL